MKISKETIERTNLGFPSEFKCKTEEEKDVTITYRYGRIKIYLGETLHTETEKDEFDINGYISDEDLLKVLKRDGLID